MFTSFLCVCSDNEIMGCTDTSWFSVCDWMLLTAVRIPEYHRPRTTGEGRGSKNRQEDSDDVWHEFPCLATFSRFNCLPLSSIFPSTLSLCSHHLIFIRQVPCCTSSFPHLNPSLLAPFFSLPSSTPLCTLTQTTNPGEVLRSVHTERLRSCHRYIDVRHL